MLIRCPECRFERQIDENAIPANAAMATCPHCQYRFRFRNPDGTPVVDETPAAAPAPQTAPAGRPLPPDLDGDDPLPPGAMVPRIPGDHDASAPTPEAPEAEPPKGQPAPPQNVAEKRSDFWNNFQKKRDGESKGKGGIAAAMHVDGTDVPWEEPKRYNLFMALYQTILRVMFNAPRFFAALPATNGKLTRPLVFYLILGMFQTLVERMWYLMSIQASGPSITDPKLQEVLGDVAQSMSLPLPLMKELSPGVFARTTHVHLRGAIDYQVLSLKHRMMMKGLCTVLRRQSQAERSPENQMILDSYGKAVDFIDFDALKPILDWLEQ